MFIDFVIHYYQFPQIYLKINGIIIFFNNNKDSYYIEIKI